MEAIDSSMVFFVFLPLATLFAPRHRENFRKFLPCRFRNLAKTIEWHRNALSYGFARTLGISICFFCHD
jgi:hypothetical protein